MKLDRNTNPDGRGKYALVKLRRVRELEHNKEIVHALETLNNYGLLHFGNEEPGEQFFVMKYKDKFTAPALGAYAYAVKEEAFNLVAKSSKGFDVPEVQSLIEYATEIYTEAQQAAHFDRIPD